MAFVVGADPTNPVASTTDGRLHKLRQTFRDYAGNVWMYAKAASAITQYNAVAIDESGNAYNLTKTLADEGQQIALAQATFAASDYGWFAISGSSGLLVNIAATCAADATLYTSSTAGSLDDNSTSQTELRGIVILTATTTSGTATCQIVYSGIVVGTQI